LTSSGAETFQLRSKPLTGMLSVARLSSSFYAADSER
jgi:hypothetical protein